jgi:sigma-E factor negative regulatory protein RseA
MTDSIKEQLSACLDGELPERELAMLCRQVDQDAQLRASMGRYALIADTLRTAKPKPVSQNFAAGVMMRVRAEATPTTSAAPFHVSAATLRRLRPVAGVAIAASVAALAVFSVQRTGVLPADVAETGRGNTMADTQAVDEMTDRYVVPALPSTGSAFIPATRLTNYVVAHSEYSSPLGRRTVLSGVLAEGDSELLDASADAALAAPQDPQP